MSNTAIKVENLSKIYRLGEIGTGTISKDLERWFRMNVMNQNDPFLKIGQTNDRTKKGESDIVYSLRDINFEIKQGESVGIIGRNGAGKSTLLKILSRVTSPTTGKIHIMGRVASLLEVGTGFHPELTGRDNIYLNGAILGMRKNEIDKNLDEIIDFSGVERYIDTPVKRYSSGMYVRLAFAVAAHLESEILIVDEVLAVGDAEFQRKCLGKIDEVSKGAGKTVLFVSHNMASVQNVCRSAIFLNSGIIELKGNINDVLQRYSNQNRDFKNLVNKKIYDDLVFEKIDLSPNKEEVISGGQMQIILSFVCTNLTFNTVYDFSVLIKNNTGIDIVHFWIDDVKINKNTNSFKVEFDIENINLFPGEYYLNLFITKDNTRSICIENIYEIVVIKSKNRKYDYQIGSSVYFENYKANFSQK